MNTYVENDELDVIVLVPGLEIVPTTKPNIVTSGRILWPPLKRAERSSYYDKLVCGHVLNTVREALAVAPGINGVTVAAIRLWEQSRPDCLLAAHFSRKSLAGVAWQLALAPQIVIGHADNLVLRHVGDDGELQPLDLYEEPVLAAMLEELICVPKSDASGEEELFSRGLDTEFDWRYIPGGQALPPFPFGDLDTLRDGPHSRRGPLCEVIAIMPALLFGLIRDSSSWFLEIKDDYGHGFMCVIEDGRITYAQLGRKDDPGSNSPITKKQAAAFHRLGWSAPVPEAPFWRHRVNKADWNEETISINLILRYVFDLMGYDMLGFGFLDRDHN